jgi:hypothetical protein
MPNTLAADQPRKMKVMARARCSGGARAPIAAAACGVNTAAASMHRPRAIVRLAMSGISALSAWPIAYQTSASASRRRRSQPPTAAASSGAPSAITTAATVMSWPPTATLIDSERDRSFSEPGTTMTPQPIAKLPASSDQRDAATASLNAAP